MRNLRRLTLDYWEVSSAVRHPDSPAMTTGDALKTLLSSDKLRPTDWKLKDLMHVIRYDIIEGGTEWRTEENQQVAGSTSTLPTKD